MIKNEEIVQHVRQVVMKSDIPVSLSFVDTTATRSTGCFKGADFEIEFSVPQLRKEYNNQRNLENPFPSILHLADLIIAHELGHAKDQLTRQYVKGLEAINARIYQAMKVFSKDGLKKHCRTYATYHQGVEEMAWAYAYGFSLLSHEPITVERYVQYCLNSYVRYYPYHFKMHAHALRLLEQWEKEVKVMDNQTFNYTIMDDGFAGYNQKTKTLEINMPHLLRTKPKTLAMTTNHYLFFQTFYLLARGQFVNYELEGKLGKLLVSIKRNGITEEDRLMVDKLTQSKRTQIQKAFAYIESKLNTHTPAYLRYKVYKMNENEEDLKDYLAYIEELVARYENKKKVS